MTYCDPMKVSVTCTISKLIPHTTTGLSISEWRHAVVGVDSKAPGYLAKWLSFVYKQSDCDFNPVAVT